MLWRNLESDDTAPAAPSGPAASAAAASAAAVVAAAVPAYVAAAVEQVAVVTVHSAGPSAAHVSAKIEAATGTERLPMTRCTLGVWQEVSRL